MGVRAGAITLTQTKRPGQKAGARFAEFSVFRLQNVFLPGTGFDLGSRNPAVILVSLP